MDHAYSDDFDEYYSSDEDYYTSDEENTSNKYEPDQKKLEIGNDAPAKKSDVSQLISYLSMNRRASAASTSELLQKIKHAADDANNQTLQSSNEIPQASETLALRTINNVSLKKSHDNMSPEIFFYSMLEAAGYPVESLPLKGNSLDENFFFQPTENHFQAYNKDVINAVQSQNINEMRQILLQKQPQPVKENQAVYLNNMNNIKVFDCCNRFGEGILHMACRRGLKDSVEFLLQEANVTLRCRDDFGRTPLHDAFWSSHPLLDIVLLLIQRDPDLLLISDARGSSPLAYAPKEQWSIWREFLQKNSDSILPRELISVRCKSCT